MAKRKVPNWVEAEREYVEGIMQDGARVYPSQRTLCDKYGIAPGTFGKKASAGQWMVKREIFSSKVQAARQEKTVEAISDAGSEFDLSCFNAAKALLDICSEKIALATAGCDVDDAKKVAETMKTLQSVGRLALGLSTDNTKSSGSMTVVAKDLTRLEQDGG